MTTNIRILLLLLLPSAAFLLADVAEGGSSNSLVQWQILSKLNYSSQIRLHTHLLLLVTVPWLGESRSLMKELADVVSHDQGRFASLKLMVLYRSSERMLADAVGADEGITIFYYHHSHSYKYMGRLRVQNILSSVHYVMSLLPEQLPFKILKTREDLEIFLGSTDKALILSEFCGWAQKLLAKGGNNSSECCFGCHEQFNGTIAAEENENQGIENAKMDCGVDNLFSDMPWLSEFTSANSSAFLVAENLSLNSGASCKIDEFQSFESFLPKFLTVSRDLFLPPERLRFGMILDRTLLSSLKVKDSGSWFVTLHFAGCPSCVKVLREGDDLKAFAKIQAWPVAEMSLILKSVIQRELYPSLLLFPAGRKKAIPYGGDVAVSNIINFLAHHGSHFYDLLQEKGILWTGSEPGINHNMNSEAPPFKNSPHEIIPQEGPPTLDFQFNQIRAPLSSSAKAALHVIVGSVLVATDKLLNVHPFDGSKVLIVKVDQSTGFQGLIVNKHISWDSLDELEDGVQLLKEAPLSFGGPVMKRGMPFVAFSRKYIVNQSMQVLPNVFFLDQRATVGIIEELRLGNQSIHDLWFFLGFSSWGWGQLFDEIAEGAWIVRNHDEEQIDWAWR